MKRVLLGSIAAQHDNIGDILIRRNAFNAFLSVGCRAVIFTGSMPREYVEAFRFNDQVKLVSNPLRFQQVVILQILKRRAHFIFSPGPHVIEDNFKTVMKSLAMVSTVALVRLSGGSVLSLGRSIRGKGRLNLFLERLISSMSSVYSVRDIVSSKNLGRSVKQVPDLAFEQAVEGGMVCSRNVLSLSFRNDSPIDVESLRPLVQWCLDNGLRVKCVSQVRRDDEQHARLAKALDVEHVMWGPKSHIDQEEVIKGVYGQSVAVISNRLHALLLGAIHGASPIEFRVTNSDKIQTTLKPWLTHVPVISNSAPNQHDWSELFDSLDSKSLMEEVATARFACRAAISEASAQLD